MPDGSGSRANYDHLLAGFIKKCNKIMHRAGSMVYSTIDWALAVLHAFKRSLLDGQGMRRARHAAGVDG